VYFYYTAMPVPTQAIGVVNIDGIGASPRKTGHTWQKIISVTQLSNYYFR